jgi:hypothetical protein
MHIEQKFNLNDKGAERKAGNERKCYAYTYEIFWENEFMNAKTTQTETFVDYHTLSSKQVVTVSFVFTTTKHLLNDSVEGH